MRRNKSVLRGLFAAVLAVLCMVQTPVAQFSAGAASLQQQLEDNLKKQQQIKSNISKLNKDKSNQQAAAKEYQAQVSNVQSRIGICNQLINQYNAELDQLEAEIEHKNQAIAQTKETFKKRLRAIQMSGDSAAVTLLLGAGNLADFLSKAQLAKNVSAYDQKIINELAEAIRSIEAAKKDVEQKQARQKDVSAQLADAQKEYSGLLSEAQQQISAVSNDLEKQKKLLAQAEAAEKELQASLNEAAKNDQNIIFTSLAFTWPVPGASRITSPYGWRIHPIYGTKKFHTGMDISAPAGKPIVASADGVIGSVKTSDSGYGNHVIINHGKASNGKSYQTLYAHMTRYIVRTGQTVKRGQVIGYVGSTGASTGNHLHFEVRIKSAGGSAYNHTNPASYVRYGV